MLIVDWSYGCPPIVPDPPGYETFLDTELVEHGYVWVVTNFGTLCRQFPVDTFSVAVRLCDVNEGCCRTPLSNQMPAVSFHSCEPGLAIRGDLGNSLI
jgi:hypothetical protein